MSAPTRIKPGATASFSVEIEEADGDPYDLTDKEVNFFIKRSIADADAAALFHGTLGDGVEIAYTVVDGVVNILIPKSVTEDIRLGRIYHWYVLLHDPVTGAYDEPLNGTFLATFPDTH